VHSAQCSIAFAKTNPTRCVHSASDALRGQAKVSKPIMPNARETRRICGFLGVRADLRDALSTINPTELRPVLHSTTRSAMRSKSITVDFELPFGVVSMDGKYVSVPCVDDQYSQQLSRADSGTVTGRIGTMTATLCSSVARPCIDVYLIPAPTNEMGVLPRALDALLEAYRHLDLFRLVTYDAGACSKATADHIRSRNLHYLLGLKGAQPQLLFWARHSFKDRHVDLPDARSVDGKGLAQVTRSDCHRLDPTSHRVHALEYLQSHHAAVRPSKTRTLASPAHQDALRLRRSLALARAVGLRATRPLRGLRALRLAMHCYTLPPKPSTACAVAPPNPDPTS
jgi:hypothetical protein